MDIAGAIFGAASRQPASTRTVQPTHQNYPSAEISPKSCGEKSPKGGKKRELPQGQKSSDVKRVADGVTAPPVKEPAQPISGLRGVGIGVWQVSGQADEAGLRHGGGSPLSRRRLCEPTWITSGSHPPASQLAGLLANGTCQVPRCRACKRNATFPGPRRAPAPEMLLWRSVGVVFGDFW